MLALESVVVLRGDSLGVLFIASNPKESLEEVG
jgi:hypothetical protein